MLVKVKRGMRMESNFLKSFRSERRKWLEYRRRGLFYALQSWCRMPHDPVSFRPDYSSFISKRTRKRKRETVKRCEKCFHDSSERGNKTKIEINTRSEEEKSRDTSFDASSQFPLTFWSYGKRKEVHYDPFVDGKTKKHEFRDHFPRFQFCSGCSRRAEYHFHEDRRRRLGGGFAYVRKDYKLWLDLLSGVRGSMGSGSLHWQVMDDVLIESESFKLRNGKQIQEKCLPTVLPPISENIGAEICSGFRAGDDDLIVDPFVQYSTETEGGGQRYVVIIHRDGSKKHIPIVEEITGEDPQVDDVATDVERETVTEIPKPPEESKEDKQEPSIDHSVPIKEIKSKERKMVMKRRPKKQTGKTGKTGDRRAEEAKLETDDIGFGAKEIELPHAPICQLRSAEVVESTLDTSVLSQCCSRDLNKSSDDFVSPLKCVMKSSTGENPEENLKVKSAETTDENKDKLPIDLPAEDENESEAEVGIPGESVSSPRNEIRNPEGGNKMSEIVCDFPSEENDSIERQNESGDETLKSPIETLVGRTTTTTTTITEVDEDHAMALANESNEDKTSPYTEQQNRLKNEEMLMDARIREMKRKYASQRLSRGSERQSIAPSEPGSEVLQIDEILSMADPYDWLSKYCIINPDRLPLYGRVFEKALASKTHPHPSSSSSSSSPRAANLDRPSPGMIKSETSTRAPSPVKKVKQQKNPKIKLITLRDPSKFNPKQTQSGKSGAQLTLDSIELTVRNHKERLVNLENHLRDVTAAKNDFLDSNPELVKIIDQLTKTKKKKLKKKGKDKKSINKDIIVKKKKPEVLKSPADELDLELLQDLKTVEGRIDYLKERIRDTRGRIMELQEEETWWKIMKEQEDLEDELTYVGMEHLLADQTGISEALHPAYNPEIDVLQMEAGLRSINGHLLTRKEFQYIYHMLRILPGRTRIDKKMFCVVAALSEKVSQLDHITKKLINKQDYNALTTKTWKAKELFNLLDVDNDTCTPESLLIELNAGGLTKEHVKIVHDKLTRLKTGGVTFLDYVTYLPLFIELHTRILDNPLSSAREL